MYMEDVNGDISCAGMAELKASEKGYPEWTS